MKTRLFISMLLLSVGSVLVAQGDSFTVTGSIKTTEGKPLKKVYVYVLDKKEFAITDSKGEFKLDKLSNQDTLLMAIPKVGNLKIACESPTINIEINKSNVNVVSASDAAKLSYIVSPSEKRTGMGSYLSREDIITSRARTLTDLLRSRIPGVRVSQSSAAPGGAVSTSVRGMSSINSGTEPLIILDGMQQSSLTDVSNSLPVELIESVEILKDGAMYGARGANGVIIVTTRRGN
ncbi:MAG: TonB-dependent receptor plug domain-containing protein [Bacteroidales bacterium]